MKKLFAICLCFFTVVMCICISANEYAAKKVTGKYRHLYTAHDGYALLIKDKTVGFTEEDDVMVDKNGNLISDSFSGIRKWFSDGNCICTYYKDGVSHVLIGQFNNPKLDLVAKHYSVSDYEDYIFCNSVLYDFSGKILYDKTQVANIFDFGNKYIACFDSENKITYLNRYTWEAFEEINFFELFDMDSDDALAISVDGKGENYYRAIDKDGNILFEKEINLGHPYSYGDYRIAVLDYQNGYCVWTHSYSRTKYVIDREGNIVVNYGIYSTIDDFTDGVARVKLADSPEVYYYNLIDTSGNLVFEKNYSYIGSFCEGLAYYSIAGIENGFMDTKGNHVITGRTAETNFKNGIAIVYMDDGSALMNKSGQIISKVYNAIHPSTEGLYLVYKALDPDSWGKAMQMGFIDCTGAEVIPLGAFSGSPTDDYRYAYVYDDPIFLSGVAFLSNGSTFYVVENPLLKKPMYVQQTNSKVMIDGKNVELGAYNIYGNNYFKIRDLAMALSGTEKQFDVAWNSNYQSITLKTNTPYIPVGGELAPITQGTAVAYHRFPQIYKNGLPLIEEKRHTWYNKTSTYVEKYVNAFNIDGNNYFKLRDICKILDVGLEWDAQNGIIHIKTTEGYVE